MQWRIANASAIGTSHLKNGQPCQDSCRASLINAGGFSTLICAVSDGAGSATHSDMGSRVAVETSTLLIENYLLLDNPITTIDRGIALSWLTEVQTTISKLSSEMEVPLREFACTLLVGIIGPEWSAFFQVGDGAMVASEGGDDGWAYIFWPQHGEYINSTNFVTSSNADEVLDFTTVARNIESFAAFSDGIENLVLHYETKTVHEPFFNLVMGPVGESSCDGIDNELSESLKKYLSSDRICERTDDDKSLILATRRPLPSPILSPNAAAS